MQLVVAYATHGFIQLILNKFLDILIDFSLTVKAATLIFISGCGSAISPAKEGKSGFIQNSKLFELFVSMLMLNIHIQMQ